MPKTTGNNDVLTSLTIEPASSTAARIAQALRETILSGELEPGTQLRETVICKAMNVSRNTVREALRELAGESLVQHTLHRGVVVAQLGPADVRDIFAVRRLLETNALAEVQGAPQRAVREIQAAAKAADRAADKGDLWALVSADLQFHEGLVRLLGSERLDTCMRNALGELRLGLATVDRAHGAMPELIHQHRQIIDAAEQGKVREAQKMLARHLDDSERLLLELPSV